MKKNAFFLMLLITLNSFIFAEEKTIYTFIVNIVPNNFLFPLIGIINIANGNHNTAQIGFFNWNKNNFIGYQAGFINKADGVLSGVQNGFINRSVGNVFGWQAGFINFASQNFNGVQTGAVNNSTGNVLGWQAGFINMVGQNINGIQTGFINRSAENTIGSQIGFINITSQKMVGAQVGFINYVESFESGIPIGFISIVRNGGYQAVEYSFSELYPINISLKTGLKHFYTSIITSYNPFIGFDINYFAIGVGFGSIIQIGNSKMFFNPEINELWRVTKTYQTFLSFVPNFGYNVNDRISILLGPSITWMQTQGNEWIQEPLFQLFENRINGNNIIFFGVRAGIRLQL